MKRITDRIDNVTHMKAHHFTTTPPPPISVKIELTATCNFKCWFCAVPNNLRKKQDMDFDLYRRLVDEMVEYGVEELGVFYLGESTLYPQLPEAIEYAKDAGMEYVFLTTNGYQIDEGLYDEIFSAGLDSLKFSYNAPNRLETIRTVRVDSFNTVVKNIRLAHEVRKLGGYDVGLFASSIEYNPNTRDEFKEALALIEPYIDEHYWLPLYNQAGFVKDKTGDDDIAGNTGRADAAVNAENCWSIFTASHITYNGLMSACCFDHDESFNMGDLKTTSFHDCWWSEKFQALRQSHLDKTFTNPHCATCLHRVNVP